MSDKDTAGGDRQKEKKPEEVMTVNKKLKALVIDQAQQNDTIKFISETTKGLSGADAALMGAGAATLSLGAAAVEVGGIAVESAMQMESAMDGFLSVTGKGKEETERYQKVLEEIYSNNYGDSFEEVAGAMAEVNLQMRDLSDDQLRSMTESALLLRDTFGYDLADSTGAVRELINSFGIDADKAMGLIAKGAQNGLDSSGELFGCLEEHAGQFAQLGLDADEMFQILNNGAETGAYGISEAGQAVGEMAKRVGEGSEEARQGFEALGLDADEMLAKFSEGGQTAGEAFRQTMEALAGLEEPLELNAAGAALFGSSFESLGEGAVAALSGIGEQAYATAEDMDVLKDIKDDGLEDTMEQLRRSLELLLVPLGEALLPLLNILAETVLPLIRETLTPLIEVITEMIEPILQRLFEAVQLMVEALTGLITAAIEPLMPVLESLGKLFEEVMTAISEMVEERLKKVTKLFRDLGQFVKDVFTGDWKNALETVKRIFGDIFDSLPSIFKKPINFIIDGINTFLRGLNNIRIPDWVPGIGGKSFHIELLPRLKKGMDFVPKDYFPTLLDYGERVLTQEQNLKFTALGGLQGMEQALGRAARDEQKLVLERGSIVVSANIDGRAAATVMAPYMDLELGSRNRMESRN